MKVFRNLNRLIPLPPDKQADIQIDVLECIFNQKMPDYYENNIVDEEIQKICYFFYVLGFIGAVNLPNDIIDLLRTKNTIFRIFFNEDKEFAKEFIKKLLEIGEKEEQIITW